MSLRNSAGDFGTYVHGCASLPQPDFKTCAAATRQLQLGLKLQQLPITARGPAGSSPRPRGNRPICGCLRRTRVENADGSRLIRSAERYECHRAHKIGLVVARQFPDRAILTDNQCTCTECMSR